MNDTELENWISDQQSQVVQYLEKQGITTPNVASWPAFEIAPYFAIWAVESKQVSGKIGWWAFSGDCPIDYVTENGSCHPRVALEQLIKNWEVYIPYMKSGKQPPNTKFTYEEDLVSLAGLLETRLSILRDWHKDDGIWENR